MRVLVATDGSKAAHSALDLVATLAWPAGTTIRIIEVVETEIQAVGVSVGLANAAELESRLVEHASATIAASERHLRGRDLTLQGGVLRGRPATEIVDEAARFRADLVVLGSRGHGTIEAMLLGSVSAEVTERARTPVMVVRSPKAHVERVLIAFDGSPAARAAAALLKTWPAFAQATVRVLSVADLGGPWWAGFPAPGAAESGALFLAAADESRRVHSAIADNLAAELRAAGRTATGISREGQPAGEIIDAAADWPADLIVMGTHARHGLARLALGSVARNVVLHGGSSVLVVPTPAPAIAGTQELEPTGAGASRN
jgi:nucleotide-binding universal stress UspA family protein